MHSSSVYASFTPAEHGSFLAAKVVAYATALLDGRNDGAEALRNARSVMCELIAAPDDPSAKIMLDPARMLLVAMIAAAGADADSPRQHRWMHVMGSLVELVRQESKDARAAHNPAPIDGTMA